MAETSETRGVYAKRYASPAGSAPQRWPRDGPGCGVTVPVARPPTVATTSAPPAMTP